VPDRLELLAESRYLWEPAPLELAVMWPLRLGSRIWELVEMLSLRVAQAQQPVATFR
jgi:hypothetical protein